MQDTNWDDLKVLITVLREGSAAAAGRHLGMNETTVARRLDRIEAALGTRLLDRRRGAYAPTGAGSELLPHAERAESEILGALAKVAGQDAQVAGLVRITSVPILVNRLLARALPALLNAHPALTVDLVSESRNLMLTRRETDIALRLSHPGAEYKALVRKIGVLEYGVFVQRGKRMSPLPWLLYGEAMGHLPQNGWIEAQGTGEDVARVRVNDAEGLIACAARGIGKAVLPRLVGRSVAELEELPVPCDLSREVWLLVHPELRRLARIETVLDWIGRTLKNAGPARAG
ncbi:MAG: LysR family transcriptional regulator [Pseudomonadota bacterium]